MKHDSSYFHSQNYQYHSHIESFNAIKQSLLESKIGSKDPKDAALLETLVLLNDIIAGTAEPRFYLSSVDPGSGKSRSIQEYIKSLKDCGFEKDFGILVVLFTFDEIKAYTDGCGLEESDYAVLCTDSELQKKGLGAYQANSAWVLFTTHEMILRRTRGKSFSDASDFHFRNRPRVLRIWDESLDPAKAVYIRLDDLDGLKSPLRAAHTNLLDLSMAMAEVTRNEPAGSVVPIPIELGNLASIALIDRNSFEPSVVRTLDGLASLGGRDAVLIKEPKGGQLALIGCSADIPEDMAPLVILDASGRIRKTYSLWDRHRGNLRVVADYVHDYRNLNINWWNLGAGKTTLKADDRREKIVNAIATEINRNPSIKTLIIHNKVEGPTLKPIHPFLEQLKEKLMDRDNVEFIHWGIHRATNKFQDFQRVFIVGLSILPEGVSKAMYLAASGLPLHDPAFDDMKVIQQSETMHQLLQGVCRCNVRNITDGNCGHAEAYIIASSMYLTEGLLAQTFPGCTITSWTPEGEKLSKNASLLANELKRIFSNPEVHSVTKRQVREASGISEKSLAKVLKQAAMLAFLKANAIAVEHHEFVKSTV